MATERVSSLMIKKIVSKCASRDTIEEIRVNEDSKTQRRKDFILQINIHSFNLRILNEIDVAIIIDQSLNSLVKKTIQFSLLLLRLLAEFE
jgi:hypothetical protein